MSSRNARGSRESVDSRVDGYDNGRNEDEENSRSHIPFDNRVRFFPDRRDILGDDWFRSRSPLRRPRYEDLQHHGNYQYRPNNFGPGFDYDSVYDPRFYPTHGESVSEFVPYPPRYYPEDNEYYEEEEYDRSRSWQSERNPFRGGSESGVPQRKVTPDFDPVPGPSGSTSLSDPVIVCDPSVSSVPVSVISSIGLPKISKKICDEITDLLTVGISTEESKSTSKEFQLVYEDPDFTLMPPKLDTWMSRRSKDKGVLKTVNAKEEALVRPQLKIMDIGPPLIDLYSRLANMEDAVSIGVRRSVQAALKQWGRAIYSYIQKASRIRGEFNRL